MACKEMMCFISRVSGFRHYMHFSYLMGKADDSEALGNDEPQDGRRLGSWMPTGGKMSTDEEHVQSTNKRMKGLALCGLVA